MEKYKILQYDPYLKPFEKDIELRMRNFQERKEQIEVAESLDSFASAYKFFGFHKSRKGYVYRECAPNAKAMFLIGDFNDWNRTSHPMKSIGGGNWEIELKENLENTAVKVRVIANDYDMDRIPLFANYVTRDENFNMTARVFETKYRFKNPKPRGKISSPIIYEAHIGMAEDKEGYGTYEEFRVNVLPRIKKEGFNTLQLMGIMEHPYYGSFGYQVSNFFAPCSLFGTPDDFRRLVDEAHASGIRVLLDIVHAHAVKNVNEGINLFDGTEGQFFLGDHPSWGTKVFDYDKMFVLKFLLSNVRYYLDEFKLDGFRFDGVTSMLYNHNGLGVAFDNYNKYFSLSTNTSAITYLQLANEVAHKFNKTALTIAEDMSGMPGMCLPISEGGIGFDYRLNMGTPDLWIKLLKEKSDEDFSMNQIYYELSSRRPMEKSIGYAESHDQALVGDKTIIFRLCDKEMYWHMQKDDPNLVIDRGISLYKLIYGLTMTLGGEGYLNFMGNEFGHPEWIDFPREGNGYSFKYAKRQWHLADDKNLKFEYLLNFNSELISLVKKFDVLESRDKQVFVSDEKKIIAFRKNNLLFACSFNVDKSFGDLFLQLNDKSNARLIFTSEEERFGGFKRVKAQEEHFSVNQEGADGVMIYLPCRSFAVYELF